MRLSRPIPLATLSRGVVSAPGLVVGERGRGTHERARELLRITRRSVRPGSGSSADFLQLRTWKGAPTLFDLGRLRAPYVLVGALATALYMPERRTDAVDLLTTPDHVAALGDDLLSAGCRRVGPLSIGGWSWVTPAGVALDLLVSGAPWAREALACPERAPDGTPVCALPYLVLLKMRAGRGQDIGDLTRMLGAAGDDALDGVRRVVARYFADAAEDLESLIAIGRLEHETGRREDG